MLEGTKNHVHVKGRRLRGMRDGDNQQSLKILKTIPLAESKRIRAALVYANRLDHKHIVPVEGAFVDGDDIVIQTPFYCGGSLRQWCKNDGDKREERSKAVVMWKIAHAVDFLHRNRLIHRDLKPGNIVMTSSRDNADPAVTDFDISKSVKESDLVTLSTRINLGTERYMAPEMSSIQGPPMPPSFETDIFAVGVTFLEMFLCDCDETALMKMVQEEEGQREGQSPSTPQQQQQQQLDWKAVAEHQRRIIDGNAFPIKERAVAIIASMLSKNPSERPSAADVSRSMREIAAKLGSCECLVCMDSFETNAGVMCGAGHFLCRESEENCFNNSYLKSQIDEAGVRRGASFKCGYCDLLFDEKTVQANMTEKNRAALQRKRESAVETKTRKEEQDRFEEEKRREAAKSMLEKEAGKCRTHIEEVVMTLRCPRCRQAFDNYSGCAALTCSNGQCGCGFCAVCLADCGSDAHNHCKQVHGSWSVSTPQWQSLMRALKQRRLEAYWGTLSPEVQEALQRDPSVRTHFTDLRMEVPGGGRRFAVALDRLHGMGFVDDDQNLNALRAVDGDVDQAIALLVA